jgi:cytochrome c biogenesis protein CcmG/thiol:disulfide interchange protein DsbE
MRGARVTDEEIMFDGRTLPTDEAGPEEQAEYEAPPAEPVAARGPLSLSRLFLLVSLAVLAVVLLLAGPSLLGQFTGSSTAAPAGPKIGPGVGNLAPDFELIDAVTGETVRLSSLRGRPVWLNFWASWCEGCREEMPLIQQNYEAHEGDRLAVIGINVQESRAAVREFTRDRGFKWTNFVLDSDGAVTDRYFVNGLPFHVFITRDGTVAAVHPGIIRQPQANDYLARILN